MIGPKLVMTGVMLAAIFIGTAMVVRDRPAICNKAVTFGACAVWVAIIGAVITIWEW